MTTQEPKASPRKYHEAELSFCSYISTCAWQILGNACRLHVFFTKKRCTIKLELNQKSNILIKSRVFGLWYTTFAENLPT